MSNLVIVAIPDENDRVWKVSSEKIPHMTLLFLGETDEVANLQQIIEFTEHAANTTLRRFWLPVDRRAELGEDKADVLFFKKGRYDYKAIRDFRAQLLKDDNIRTAYDSSPQHDGVWQPHLTLGYPGSPAKPDETDRDYGFYDVQFNKIAVWPDDYNGPEFLLKDYWDEFEALETVPMDVAMSGVNQARIALGLDAVENIEHYGVRGMRWGVRKEDVENAAKSGTTAVAKAVRDAGRFAGDIQFEARTAPRTDPETGSEKDSKARELVIDAAHKDFKAKDLSAINAKPEYVKTKKLHNRLLKPFDKTTKAYRAEVKAAYIQRLETTANAMKNPSGTREYSIRERGGDLPTSKYYWEVSTREARHAAGDDFTLVEVLTDDDGFITGTKVVKNEMGQTADLGAEFLMHYGVKGMRWGVRRDRQGRDRFQIEGHSVEGDVARAVGFGLVPVAGYAFMAPSAIRLGKRVKNRMEEKKSEKSDRNWNKDLDTSIKKAIEVNNKAADEINPKIKVFNNDKRWAGVDLTKDPKRQAAYDKAYAEEIHNPAFARASVAIHGSKSPGGRYELSIKDPKTATMKVRDTLLDEEREVQHAAKDDDADYELDLVILRDAQGHISGFDWPKGTEVEHSTVELGSILVSSLLNGDEDVLEHYGVKGMRWGVRRNQDRAAPTAVSPSATSRVPHGDKRKTKIETEGGENHPAADDAIKVAKARVKLSKSGTVALSNQELREVANRLQLEEQVKRLTAPAGKKFVTNLLRSETQQGGQQLFRAGAKKSGKKIRKVALGF